MISSSKLRELLAELPADVTVVLQTAAGSFIDIDPARVEIKGENIIIHESKQRTRMYPDLFELEDFSVVGDEYSDAR